MKRSSLPLHSSLRVHLTPTQLYLITKISPLACQYIPPPLRYVPMYPPLCSGGWTACASAVALTSLGPE